MVKVKVPATSANVGCGFDTLGLALSLYTTFTFEEVKEGLIWEGCEKAFQNENNLIYTSFLSALQFLEKKVNGVKITIDCNVPVSRGLGSSSTCVIGGIVGAFALTNSPINRETILRLATQIEGHPDNVAPAIYGGLCAACMVDGEVFCAKYNINDELNFQVLIPNFETMTRDARKALPDALPFHDAIYSLSRLPLVIRAFETADLEMLNKVMGDKVHEPYRKKLIHEYEEVKTICENIDSQAFFISGSGSTLMNVLKKIKNANPIEVQLEQLKQNWKSMVLTADKKGFEIL